jgi:hypothetical protein
MNLRIKQTGLPQIGFGGKAELATLFHLYPGVIDLELTYGSLSLFHIALSDLDITYKMPGLIKAAKQVLDQEEIKTGEFAHLIRDLYYIKKGHAEGQEMMDMIPKWQVTKFMNLPEDELDWIWQECPAFRMELGTAMKAKPTDVMLGGGQGGVA